jgi:hypothetical protein
MNDYMNGPNQECAYDNSWHHDYDHEPNEYTIIPNINNHDATPNTNLHATNNNTTNQRTIATKQQYKRTKFDDRLIFITQNIRGLPSGDNTKIQSLVHQMKTKEWAAICIQETWLLGSDEFYIDGYKLLLQGHSTKTNERGHVKAGVGIALSPTLDAAHKLAGCKKITLPPNHEYEGRFLGIHLHFKKRDNYGKKLKGTTKIILCSLYHPVDPKEHSDFGATIQTLLNNVPADTSLLFGHDINCNVGTNKTLPDTMKHVVGPFGLENRNPKGTTFLQQLCAMNMRVANSYFQKPNYATWKNFNNNKSSYHMLDVFCLSVSLFKHVTGCGTSKHGIDHTDHTASAITLNIGSIVKKQHKNSSIHGGRTDWTRISLDPDAKREFNDRLHSGYEHKSPTTENYTVFNETTLEAAKATAIASSKPTRDWFEMSKHKIQPLIDRITMLRALQRSTSNSNPSQTTRELKLCIRLKTIAIREAKSNYMSHIAEKIGTLSGNNTKEMWDAIKT